MTNTDIKIDDALLEEAFAFEEASIEIIATSKRKTRSMMGVAILALAGVGCAAISSMIGTTVAVVAAVIVLLIGTIYRSIVYGPVLKFRRSVKLEFGNKLMAQYDPNLALTGRGYDRMKFDRDLKGVIPEYDRFHSEDLIEGTYKSTPLRFYEVRLEIEKKIEEKGPDDEVTTTTKVEDVFRGFVVSIGLKRDFQGEITIRKNSIVNAVLGQERVRLESDEFENLFDVFATDQITSRTLLTPVFIENMTALANNPSFKKTGLKVSKKISLGEQTFQATVRDDFLHLMIPSNADKFEVYDDGQAIKLDRFVETFQMDMNAIVRCIEGLNLADEA